MSWLTGADGREDTGQVGHDVRDTREARVRVPLVIPFLEGSPEKQPLVCIAYSGIQPHRAVLPGWIKPPRPWIPAS